MNALAQLLARQIAADGPMRLADYMAACLLHPVHGYYTRGQAFGAAGDFTTAPEISQMFGELVGLALAQAWIDQGAPARFTLAELGPGRGTLMADLLRATRGVPGFHAGADLVLVEASPALRAAQARALAAGGVTPRWADTADALPDDAPLLLVANEFFDALPIRQFRRDPAGWCERVVGLRDGALAPGWSPPGLPAPEGHAEAPEGAVVETCPAAAPVIAAIAGRIAAHGGAALIVDYGGEGGRGDTFQALRGHNYADPFDAPGEADLTAHVDFAALARAARAVGVTASRPTPQGAFLDRLGIGMRAEALARNLAGDALDSHTAATRRLTHADEMGTLFKALGLWPTGAAPLAGLDA